MNFFGVCSRIMSETQKNDAYIGKNSGAKRIGYAKCCYTEK